MQVNQFKEFLFKKNKTLLFKKNPLISYLGLKKGKHYAICICGEPFEIEIEEVNKDTRCYYCNLLDRKHAKFNKTNLIENKFCQTFTSRSY